MYLMHNFFLYVSTIVCVILYILHNNLRIPKYIQSIKLKSVHQFGPCILVTNMGGFTKMSASTAKMADPREKKWSRDFGFTETEIAELKECFSLFDRNGDGVITTTEFGDVMRAMGQNPTEAEVQQWLNECDINENGTICFDEYVRVQGARGLKSDQEMRDELEEALKVFDKDGNGFIDANEFRNALRTLGEPVTDHEVEDMMRLAGVDAKGRMKYNDFARQMLSK